MASVIFISGVSAQSPDKNNSLFQSAEHYLALARDGKWNAWIDATHPGYVQYYGGKRRLVKLLENWERIDPVTHSLKLHFITEGDENQAVLSFRNATGERKFLLASSMDKGNTWTYLPVPEYLAEQLHNVIPDASDKLVSVIHAGYMADSKLASF